ncbi:MAG: cytochrome c [Bacteroidetes bacterium]|nr:cytochrome c [Bacteroidota bacterium]
MKQNKKNQLSVISFQSAVFLFTFYCLLFTITSCNNVPNSPGWEYMPDMYRSPSYETNSSNPNFSDSLTDRKPVPGTISQGWIPNSEFSSLKVPYPYKNDSLGYELAGHNLKDPFPASAEIIDQGKVLYGKYCIHCHGATGQGDGAVVTVGNHPPPPAYNGAQLKNLPEGKMFHALQYGKNMMGSHASQLTVADRWKIIRFVQTLQNPGGIVAATVQMVSGMDSTKKENVVKKKI